MGKQGVGELRATWLGLRRSAAWSNAVLSFKEVGKFAHPGAEWNTGYRKRGLNVDGQAGIGS